MKANKKKDSIVTWKGVKDISITWFVNSKSIWSKQYR